MERFVPHNTPPKQDFSIALFLLQRRENITSNRTFVSLCSYPGEAILLARRYMKHAAQAEMTATGGTKACQTRATRAVKRLNP
jgi:hypothetical protein